MDVIIMICQTCGARLTGYIADGLTCKCDAKSAVQTPVDEIDWLLEQITLIKKELGLVKYR